MKLPSIYIIFVLALAARVTYSGSPINTLFTEDFETPVVSAYDEQPPTPAGWVSAIQGFGAGRHGLCNKDGSNFTAQVGNDQVIAFRYTNSGITTDEEVISPLVLDATYTITFDVVRDLVGTSTGIAYNVQLIAFGPGAARDDCRNTPGGSTVLATKSGSAPSDGSWSTNNTIVFYADPVAYAPQDGLDLGIRMKGSITCGSLDNFLVMDDIPAAGTVIQLY